MTKFDSQVSHVSHNAILHRVAPKKVSHYQIIKKLCYIVLKSANEIRFLRQIKEISTRYNIIRQY